MGASFEELGPGAAKSVGVHRAVSLSVTGGRPAFVGGAIADLAGDGWAPLCEALGVAVPDEDFPHVNTTEQFRERAGLEA